MSSSDEEETVVIVELNGILENDWMNRIGDKCKIIGLDQDQPVLQLDRYIFRGQYQDTVGSQVLFEKEQNEKKNTDDQESSDEETSKDKYIYKCHTHKKLHMKRAFLTEKPVAKAAEMENSENGSQPSTSDDPPPSTSQDMATTNQDMASTNQDMASTNQDMASTSQDTATTSQEMSVDSVTDENTGSEAMDVLDTDSRETANNS